MTKKIIIAILIYFFLVLGINIGLTTDMEMYIPIILFVTFIFLFYVIREIYLKYLKGFKVKNEITDPKSLNSDINNLNIDVTKLKKISSKPFLLGLEKLVVGNESFYFDDLYFYVINKDGKGVKYLMKDITEVSKTKVKLNNTRIWQVIINENNKSLIFKFAHNYTLWNKNFPDFLDTLNKLKPSVIKNKWNIF